MARRNQRQIEYERQLLYRQLAQLEREEQEVTAGGGTMAMGIVCLVASLFIFMIPVIGVPLGIFAIILGIGAILSKPKLNEIEETMHENLDPGTGATPSNVWSLLVALFWGTVIISLFSALGFAGMFATYTGGR